MINSPLPGRHGADSGDADVSGIVRSGPGGALWLAGMATAIVLALWLAFYYFVFVPRGTLY
jgi:hypothetical protein